MNCGLISLLRILVAVWSLSVSSSRRGKDLAVNCTHCDTEDCETVYGFDSLNPYRNFCLIEFGSAEDMGWAVLNFNINKDFIHNNNNNNNNNNNEITLDLYAGATDCNLDNGIIVGEVMLTYKSMNNEHIITMTYIVDEPFYFTQVNGYAGHALLPFNNNGVHTTIPKDFPRSYSNDDGFSSYSFDFLIQDTNENFNIIAHSIVKKLKM